MLTNKLNLATFGILLLCLNACGGGTSSESTTNSNTTPTSTPAPAQASWTRYLGSHYTLTPATGLIREWADGGLRDPGGNRTNYQITANGSGGYADDGYAAFTNTSLPVIDSLLAESRYAVLTVGGVSSGNASIFFDSMDTVAGRDAFRAALHNRIDAIRTLSHAAGWEQKIYFQFGNEIQNPNGYYGAVCTWVKKTPTTTCDLQSEFIPAYVERYLAPGVAILEEKSQALFGRPDAIRMTLGSIVNLANQEDMLNSLLNYQVQGSFASAYQGKRVYELIDTVTIHYTASGTAWRTALDNFRHTYVPAGKPLGRVHRLWATEEVGAGAAEQGYGMASTLRAFSHYLSWWQSNNMGPDDGHMFIWGSDISGTCSGCTSVDADIGILHTFTGNRALLTVSNNPSSLTASANTEIYEFSVEATDKRVITVMSSDLKSTTVNSLTLQLSMWNGRNVRFTAYQHAAQGPVPIVITPSTTVVTTAPMTIDLPITLGGRDVLLLLVEAL